MLPRLDQLDTLWRLFRHHRVSREKLLAFQNRKLRRVIKYAYRDVAYYRRLFDEAGVKPEDIRTAADLSLLPITTKNDLRSQPPEDILASWAGPERIITFGTSGSGAEPFSISHAPFEKFLLKNDEGARQAP